MTDIGIEDQVAVVRCLWAEIERLQAAMPNEREAHQVCVDMRNEAEATIERLQAALATCRELREYDRKEIERLQTERDELGAIIRDELRPEIERLRAATRIEQTAWDKLVDERDKQRAEIKRLHLFLGEIAAMGPADDDEEWDADTLESAVALAQRALDGDKP